VENGSIPDDGRCTHRGGISTRVVLSCNPSAKWTNQDLGDNFHIVYYKALDPCVVSSSFTIVFHTSFRINNGYSAKLISSCIVVYIGKQQLQSNLCIVKTATSLLHSSLLLQLICNTLRPIGDRFI
jgi:hypothetical protein